MKRKRVLIKFVITIVFLFGISGVNCGVALGETEPITWKMSSYVPASFDFYKGDEHFIKTVDEMSGGRLKIKLYPVGSLVGTYDIFDAVGNGTLNCSSDWPTTWSGISKGFDLIGTTPMLFTSMDYQIWLYEAGGLKMVQDLYAKYNIKWFPTLVTSMEGGHRTRKPINSIADYKGLKIRQSGRVQGKVLEALGASPVSMAGGEIYTAMERGVIDGCEFSAPVVDYSMGLHEVVKYAVTPAWYQTSTLVGVCINMDDWNRLPKDLQAIVEGASKATMLWYASHCQYGSMQAVKKMAAKGVKTTHLSPEDLMKIQELANKYMEEEAASDKDYAKILKSMVNYLKDIEEWRKMQEPFSWGSGRSGYPKIP